MRYHSEQRELYVVTYGKTYVCDHPVYNKCTLYLIRDKGLAVIQQRYNKENKSTYWGEIDPWLVDQIYINPNFIKFFNARSGAPLDGLYPTVSVRQIMWGLRMKPLIRERWETCFDRRLI